MVKASTVPLIITTKDTETKVVATITKAEVMVVTTLAINWAVADSMTTTMTTPGATIVRAVTKVATEETWEDMVVTRVATITKVATVIKEATAETREEDGDLTMI